MSLRDRSYFHHGIEVVGAHLRRRYRKEAHFDVGERPRLGYSDREVAESLWPKSGRVEIKRPSATRIASATTRRVSPDGNAR